MGVVYCCDFVDLQMAQRVPAGQTNAPNRYFPMAMGRTSLLLLFKLCAIGFLQFFSTCLQMHIAEPNASPCVEPLPSVKPDRRPGQRNVKRAAVVECSRLSKNIGPARTS
jgi:hypothetical protein